MSESISQQTPVTLAKRTKKKNQFIIVHHNSKRNKGSHVSIMKVKQSENETRGLASMFVEVFIRRPTGFHPGLTVGITENIPSDGVSTEATWQPP